MKKQVEKLIEETIEKLNEMTPLQRFFLNIHVKNLNKTLCKIINKTSNVETENLETLDVLNSIDQIVKEILEKTLTDTYLGGGNELLQKLNMLLYYLNKLEGEKT